MKKDFAFLRILVLLLCIIMAFSACASVDNTSSIISSENSFSSSDISSEETTSGDIKPTTNNFGVPFIEQNDQYGDLLLQIASGKRVTALGALADEKYSDAISRLEAVLDGYSREISVVAYSLDNRKSISYNAEAELFPACTVKAFYSLYCCLQMDKGNGSLDTEMTYEKKHYEPGTGDMQYSALGTVFDMKTIIHKSMSISDNVGYLMQVDYFGREGYNKWVSDLGCPSLQIKPTVWALRAKADEHAVMWRELYRYFTSDAAHSEFLYNTCTGTDGNFASSALGKASYSHKQGFNRGDWNSMSDAGIVWKDGSPYIIVILTNSQGITSSAQKVMDEAINIIHNELF